MLSLTFSCGLIPSVWRKAIICPILKDINTDPRVPSNYRGISLLSVVAKIYSSVLNNRLTSHLEENDLLVDEQNGFRGDRSCLDHVFTLSSIVKNRNSTFVTFIDLRKAFDMVDRELMEFCLLKNGIDGQFYNAIKSLYTDTESCVRLGNRLTDWFSCRSGVKQGDNLSPTIFSLFINDLAMQIKALNKGVPVGDLNISILLYADDIALITQNEKDMQALLNTVESWCKQWRLKIITDKTKVVHFRKRQRNRSQLTLKLNGRDLSYESSYKYLGVIFDEFASFKDNAENLAKSAGRALGSVISKIHGIKSVGFRTFEKLFLCGVAPIIDYCSGVWGHKEFHNLHSVQLKAMRYFLGVHRFTPILAIQGESGWPPTVVRHRVNVLRLWNRLTQMDADRVTRKIFEWDLTEFKPDSWSSQTNDLFASLGLDSMFRNRQPCDISASEGKLIDIYKDKWNSDLATVSKLRTYRLFKTVFKTEDYLYMNIPKSVRSTFSMFRCGILRFRGESPDERLCTVCNSGEIEDEKHFLLSCVKYQEF
ncbi:hypothetical protein FSP39_008861 [Pinctada imbricata]|uniref:Reverse transcriptase domain-containing protein n=1 Tax=Pinctada imbricata TaxID=66713 RepID=A0AA89BRK7_PINIB|nr:hypothetical protein FSP39_008861 [Pinctada imbricata]